MATRTQAPSRSVEASARRSRCRRICRHPSQSRAGAVGSGRLAKRFSRIRMALAAQRHDRHASRLRPPALARRIPAGAQNNLAARRAWATPSDCARCWRKPARPSCSSAGELKTLLTGLQGVASCHARGEKLPAYEVHCPLGSLPLAFKTEPATVPAEIPYLRADEARLAKWRPRIEALPANASRGLGRQCQPRQ